MSYIVCKECGGYYKLQEGESSEDFGTCQCGGTLRYTNSIREVFRPEAASNIRYNFKSENIKLNQFNSKYGLDNVKPTFKVNRPKETYNESILLLDRISFLVVFVGIVFYFISVIITAFGVIGSIIISNNDVMTSFIGFSIILVFLMIASGFIASYLSGGKNYEDGLLNGDWLALV